jgi:hypothetical protein
MGFGVFDVGDWSEGEVLVDKTLNNGVSFAEGDVHLDAALAVAHIVRFLVGELVDVGEEGGEVVVSHVLEGELPELLVLVRVVLGVVPGMFVPPAVAQPDIVAFVGEHEGWSLALVVDEPSIGAVQEAVLQNDGFEAWLDGGGLSLDAENGEHISVFG